MSEIQDNPYSAIINVFRGDTEQRQFNRWITATVTSVSPLKVSFFGQTLYGRDILVNSQLLAGAQKGTAQNADGSFEVTLDSVLAAGDTVVLLPDNEGQRFVVLCKAVQA